MGMDCVRYIEVQVEEIIDSIDKNNINKLGKLDVGDVILVYNDENHYWKISSIDIDGKFVYDKIDTPSSIEEYSKWDKPEIAYRVSHYEDLPTTNVILNDGDIYKIYRNGTEYVKYTNGEFITIEYKDVPKHWEVILRLTSKRKEPYYFATSASSAICKYVYNRWGDDDGMYAGRGIPDDITDLVKADLDGQFGFTYCTLLELEALHDIALETFKNHLNESYNNTKIHKIDAKIDCLLKHTEYVEPEDDDVYYDTPAIVFDEEIYDVINVFSEYNIVHNIVREHYGYNYRDNNVRIIYAFNN